jgi:phosphate starvation-inducible PhoH-like protein
MPENEVLDSPVADAEHEAASHEIALPITDPEAARLLLGTHDATRRLIERELPVTLDWKDDQLLVRGEATVVTRAAELIEQLLEVAKRSLHGGRGLQVADIERLVYSLKRGEDVRGAGRTLSDTLLVSERGKPIGPRTAGQKIYLDAVRKNDLTFCIGPAGTGKTYLAVAAAVAAFKAKEVARIILTRPAVEAGERLGFLPGDLEAKIDPYLRPLFDALYDMLETEKAQKLISARTIEVAPLAYMRGRTLNDAFVILDEAQNTTPMQMKMFLTRLGFGSKMIVTGDVTQTDLPAGQESGLRVAARLLAGVRGIDFVHLDKSDIVRHTIVQRIIEAYEKNEGVYG